MNAMQKISPSQLEQCQGVTQDDRPFGFVHGTDGGFFFRWMPTLEETLSSVEPDRESGNGGLDQDAVTEFLRAQLPRTKRGKDSWGLWGDEVQPIQLIVNEIDGAAVHTIASGEGANVREELADMLGSDDPLVRLIDAAIESRETKQADITREDGLHVVRVVVK